MKKEIIASGPVIVENRKVLLNKHKDSFWKLPGGTVEKNEEYRDTAKREVREEMGIDIEILNQEPFIFFVRKKTDEGNIDIILVHFLAKRIDEIEPGEDIREWDWLDIDNLPEDIGSNIIPTLKHFGFIKN